MFFIDGRQHCFTVYCFNFHSLRFQPRGILICGFIALAVSALGYYLFRKVLFPAYFALKIPVRMAALVALAFFSLLFAKVLTYDMPHLYFLYPPHQLEVRMDLREQAGGFRGGDTQAPGSGLRGYFSWLN